MNTKRFAQGVALGTALLMTGLVSADCYWCDNGNDSPCQTGSNLNNQHFTMCQAFGQSCFMSGDLCTC